VDVQYCADFAGGELHQMAVKKQPVEPMDGRPKSRTGFQVLDFVSETEIAFAVCVMEKAPDGTFSTSCEDFSIIEIVSCRSGFSHEFHHEKGP